MGQGSVKVEETKKKIKVAFMELYGSRRIDKISVKEVAALAGINRGTFYVYYMDIYDLLEKVEEETILLFEKTMTPIMEVLLKGEEVGELLPPKGFFEENKMALDFLFGEKANPAMQVRFKERVKSLALRKLLRYSGDLPLDIRYVVEYLASAQFGLITYWYQRHFEIQLDELARLVKMVNFNGPLTYLLDEAKFERR